MKYYLIAGEASGDLHASRLMWALKNEDKEAQFRCFGGDHMAAAGATLVKHYRELAYMGIGPVLRHLPTILSNMRMCKDDIRQWQPDVVILVDYPGFNLKIAKYVKQHAIAPVHYYISPKIWAWKEFRIKNIKRDVDQLYSILPFEVDFFEGKHHYPIHYVGNPTMEEVTAFLKTWHMERESFYHHNTLSEERPLLALLCGSRRQEIKGNLPVMLSVADKYAKRYTVVVAGAPGIERDYYTPFLEGHQEVKIVYGQTYGVLAEARAALVTSGTATLEAALFGVPQVVCYKTPLPRLYGMLKKVVLNVKYVSLVNLIADREVVKELVANLFTKRNVERELENILNGPQRQQMEEGYEEVRRRLGTSIAPDETARLIVNSLTTTN